MFRTRLLSGIVLVIVTFGIIFAGGWVMAGALCAISLIAFFELTKATGVHTQGKKINGLEIAGVIMVLLYYTGLYVSMVFLHVNHYYSMDDCYYGHIIYRVLAFSIVMFLIIIMLVYVFSFPKFKAGQVMACFFELIYAPVLLSFLLIIRDGCGNMIWLVFLCSWGSDTCAYCVGVLFGKHKMAPKLSPKKSIEGGIGGVVGAALLFILYNFIINLPNSCIRIGFPNMASAMCLGAVGALVSMIGDLAASAIKRDYEIKDYGNLIPGHGGIMDRFDSVIIVAPFIFFGLVLMG